MQAAIQAQPVATPVLRANGKAPSNIRNLVRFVTLDGTVIQDTRRDVVLSRAESLLGVLFAVDYSNVADHGTFSYVRQVRESQTGEWVDVQREPPKYNGDESVWNKLMATVHAFPNTPEGPCPYDDEGNLICEDELELA
ncbi:hypothetical protein SAMN05216466_10684 [Paraburkholderia phenazinium]|uniref:Uncharacterized protein n=1 Tax=Paraburkholderia phenazinium TaxID=60549 RepID=A0A1G7Y914_9BURK|nr:hypothetical protein [Paraburkholderia phenazinium]SDG92813.1 hypothetical protein SAMN05216466_10684 [Paraburkholderia phenazinium]